MTRRRNRELPGRVLLGLSEVGGYYTALAEGLRNFGVDAEVLTLAPHPFDYQEGKAGRLQRFVWSVTRSSRRVGRVGLPLEGVMRVVLFLCALIRYDTFVFGFRNSFLLGRDLPVLRLAGKRVVSVFHGTDSRPPYLDPVSARGLDAAALYRRTRSVERTALRFERWSHEIVCGPLSAHFFREPVVAFQRIGIPVSAASSPPMPEVTRIVHAPSDTGFKGTARIREAIDELREAGFEFDYVELVDRPNAEVLVEIGRSSFVIDQLFTDTNMATFAAEAAARGRGAVVGSSFVEELTEILEPAALRCSRFCSPDDLQPTVRSLLLDRSEIESLGRRAREFVTQTWSVADVAGRLLAVLRDEVPDVWRFDPARIATTAGCLPHEVRLSLVQGLLDLGGPAALCLDHHPALRDAIVAEAAAQPSTTSTGPAAPPTGPH